MKKSLALLSLLLFISSQIQASDYLALKTLDDTTVLPYQMVGQIGVTGSEQIDKSTLIAGPTFDTAFAICDWAELGLNYEVLTLLDSPSFDDTTGSGDLRIRLKAIPIQTRLGNLGLAVITKIPTASNQDGLGTKETDVTVKGIYGTTIAGDLHLFANAGIAIQGDPRANSSQDNYFVWGIGAEYPLYAISSSPIVEGLRLIAEFEGAIGSQDNINIAQGEYNDGQIQFRGGIVREFSWFNLAATGSVGITDDSPGWGFQVSLSRAFDLPILNKE